MKKTARFVIWICSKFTREEIEEIIQGLLDVLARLKSSQFKLRYQYREYHFTQEELSHSLPEEKNSSSLFKTGP